MTDRNNTQTFYQLTVFAYFLLNQKQLNRNLPT